MVKLRVLGEELSSYGFVYAENSNPTSDDNKLEVSENDNGNFRVRFQD